MHVDAAGNWWISKLVMHSLGTQPIWRIKQLPTHRHFIFASSLRNAILHNRRKFQYLTESCAAPNPSYTMKIICHGVARRDMACCG